MPSHRGSFFPKADATVLQSRHKPPSPSSRPTIVAPILDIEHANTALDIWTVEVAESVYPEKEDACAAAPIPDPATCPQQCSSDRYLFPILTRDERLRLTMLFYYTRGILEDQELMSRLQERVILARETVDWEFVIAGLLDHNTYTRMVTVGLPLAILPRRESTCAHTVNQPPGTVFSLLNMVEDWRFKGSPHVDQGGLRAYAGVPLRFETEFGQHVAFGSLCVASNSAQAELTKSQQRSLARLADWIVADIIHSARARRQRERKRLQDALAELQLRSNHEFNMETAVLEMLRNIYPNTTVDIHVTRSGRVNMEGGAEISTSDLEHGLWEDHEYFDYLIEEMNHQDMVAPKTVRVIAARCASQRLPTYLTVGSRDFRDVFDDIDSWFVNMSATLLCRYWQDQALVEALTAKEVFLRGITHQLRTPIHGILGSVELLTEELKARNVIPITNNPTPGDSPENEQLDPYVYVKTIRTSARELISTVNSLIKLNQWTEIAQAERDIKFHHITEIESTLLNESKLAMPEDSSMKPTLMIQHDFPWPSDLIAIDMRLFLDCIQPLVANAIQNTSTGVVSVTLSLDEALRSLVVDIEDNGRGIPLDQQERIFDAYGKVETSTTRAGLGLTLSCKSATLLGGNVALVSSEMGRGSHFRATLDHPICASSLDRKLSKDPSLVHLPPVYFQVPLSQDITIARRIANLLERRGFVRSEVSDGALLLLECVGDLSQLHQYISKIPTTQVAICLIPNSAGSSMIFEQQQIQRQNNIIYAKGPFMSSTLDNILNQAGTILGELRPAAPGTDACHTVDGEVGDSLKIKERKTSSVGGADLSLVIETQLLQSIRKLGDEVATASLSAQRPFNSTKPKALLVDDNAVNLRLLELYCSRRTIPYCAAKDGNEAVDLFLLNRQPMTDALLQQTVPVRPFDIILMDLQMPNCDGIEATRRIRELEKENGWQKSMICMITGQDSAADRENAAKAGSDWYLVKPVGPKVLDRWMKQWFPDAEI